MLFATCSYSLFGQSSYYHRMETAIDLGVHDSAFSYTKTFDTRDYSDDYTLSPNKVPYYYIFGNDVFFKLTLTRSLDLFIWRNNHFVDYVFIHLRIFLSPYFPVHITSLPKLPMPNQTRLYMKALSA